MTANNLDQIHQEWENYLKTGVYDETVIRTEVADSWKRCRTIGVDPNGGICERVLKGRELKKLLEDNKELISIARPVLNSIYMFLKGSGYYVVLANKDVYLLDFFGDTTMEKEASLINYMKGACWKEEYVGTTVLGVMPYVKKPIQMAGAEHYCVMSQGFTCSAAPIISDEGEFLGLVSISGPVKDAHKHTLGMVVAACQAIRNYKTVLMKNRQLMEANDYIMSILKNVSEAIIAYDRLNRVMFVNPAAREIIGAKKLEGLSVDSFFKAGKKGTVFKEKEFHDVECSLITESGVKSCLVSGMPLSERDNISGTVVVIRPIETVHKLMKKYGNTQARIRIEDIAGESVAISKVIRLAKQAARSDGTILLQGESGTGKEVFAQAIHNLSRRSSGPFVGVNCGAIPRDLVGSELFGYSEGAFTGAAKGGRLGKFELASKGTIFLDEIGDMPLEQQVNLLRVLQERYITRIGSNEMIPVDVRVIAASNKSLKEEMKRGSFREDLYYRLNVISIEIPPLRERKDDIELLFRHFARDLGENAGYGDREIDPDIFEYLLRYDWPGNVRELQNVAERAMSLSVNNRITVEDLPPEIVVFKKTPKIRENQTPPVEETEIVSVGNIRSRARQNTAETEKKEIKRALLESGGNISAAAESAGFSRSTFYRKMKKYGLD